MATGAAIAANTNASPTRATTVRVDRRTGRLVRVPIQPAATAPNKVAPPAQRAVEPSADIDQLVEKTAEAYQVDPLLVHSVIQVESNYNPNAVSPKGARGIMQLIPATARRFGVQNSFDPKQNIDGGVRYLKYLNDLFGDESLAVAAYNAGEGAVQKHGQVPPYAETQAYVAQVSRKVERARKAAAAKKQPPAMAAVQIAKQPDFRPLESYYDEQGRLCLRTK